MTKVSNLGNKDYEQDTLWFFVKRKNKVVAIGGLRPIKIKYLRKNYDIRGICSIISLEKKKDYGKIIIKAIIKYLEKKGKTGIGFCGKEITKFYKKSGLKIKKDFINRFIYKNPKTGKETIDKEGDGIYYEGKDKFISKVLKTKSPIFICVEHW
ncbi:MAG: hypothetical protein U9Q06_04335 [Nanoarchaeota archaeon]|nr:hypothetical protein [Nanoarchaeota archaeon]